MDIRKVKTIVISPDHNEKYHNRKETVIAMLRQYGFENVSHFKSGTDKYPTCLSKAFIDILSEHLNDEPVLILEDDVNIYKFDDTLVIPKDADAVYLGLSVHGAHPTLDTCVVDGVKKQHITDQISKVLNMLSTHAILYISERYKRAVIDILNTIIGWNSDVVISRYQPVFNVYCVNTPMFYQNDETSLTNSMSTFVQFTTDGFTYLNFRQHGKS